jgi:hypothetical protein
MRLCGRLAVIHFTPLRTHISNDPFKLKVSVIRGLDFDHMMSEDGAHKGGMRIGNKPKKTR